MSKKSNTPIVVTPDVLSRMADRLLHELKSGRPTTKLGLLNTIAASIAGPKRNHGYLKAADKPVYANGIDLEAVQALLLENLASTPQTAEEVFADPRSEDFKMLKRVLLGESEMAGDRFGSVTAVKDTDFDLVMGALEAARLIALEEADKHDLLPEEDEAWLEINVIMNLLRSNPEVIKEDRLHTVWTYLSNLPKAIDTKTADGFDRWVDVRRAFIRLKEAGHPDAEWSEHMRNHIVNSAQWAFQLVIGENNFFKEYQDLDIPEDDFNIIMRRAAQKYLLEVPHPTLNEVKKYGGGAAGNNVLRDIFENTTIIHLEALQEALDASNALDYPAKSSGPSAVV